MIETRKEDDALLLDVMLEMAAADMSLNRKWADNGKRLSPVYRQLKKDLRALFREELKGSMTREAVQVQIWFCGLCDIDAPLKLLFDSMEHAVYHNDSQIERLIVQKDPEATPLIRIRVTEIWDEERGAVSP